MKNIKLKKLRFSIIKITSVYLFIFFVTFFTSCKNENIKNQNKKLNPREGVYYSLFVRSFADSDGDGIGDFNGIAEKLDYLENLGISGIWLLPIYESHSYHGYDVDNYYEVNPQYGTMKDFENLVKKCSERGIAVMLDITFNHSSVYNDYFIASKNPDDFHRQWYHWISADDKNYNLNQKIWGHNLWNKDGDFYYAGEFDSGMPDYNLDSRELREEFKNIISFWMQKGVSGFRFDAAGHIYDKIKMPSDFSDSTTSANEFWKEITEYVHSINANSFCVAEVWDTTAVRSQSLAGLESVFHFDLGDPYIFNFLKNESAGNNNFAHILENDFSAYKKFNPDFIDVPFLTNHDQARAAGVLGGDVQKLKVAAGMYLLAPGIPFVYYGEEIGMKSGTKDETKRTPLLWGKNDKFETRWADENDCIYNAKTIDIKTQNKDKNSLLNYYKKIINFRNSHSAFNGNFSAYDTKNENIISWILSDDSEKIFVVHNVSKKDTVIELPKDFENATAADFQTYKITKTGDGRFSIPPLCTVVFCNASF